MSKKVSCLKDLLKKFGELKKLSPLPPVYEFNYLLKDALSMGEGKETVTMFTDMCAIGVPVSEDTVSIVIESLGKLNKTKEASSLYHLALNALRASGHRNKIPCLVAKMAHEKIPVAEYLYNEAFNVSWDGGNQNQAVKILDYMAREGFVTCTNIIRLHCRNNRLEIANGIFRSLATKGSNVNIVEAKVILNTYVHLQRYNEAFTFFQTVTSNVYESIKVDSSFYTCMIIGLLKDDNVAEALRQMDSMEQKKIEPEDSAYYALFNWMCNNSRYKEAENLFFRMKKHQVVPKIETYNSHHKEAEALKPRVVPDIETYNGLFYVYLQTNEYEKADKLVKEMVELSIPITYRVVSFVVKNYMAKEIRRFLDPFIEAELVAADIISPVRENWAGVKKWKTGSVVFKQSDVDDVGIQP